MTGKRVYTDEEIARKLRELDDLIERGPQDRVYRRVIFVLSALVSIGIALWIWRRW